METVLREGYRSGLVNDMDALDAGHGTPGIRPKWLSSVSSLVGGSRFLVVSDDVLKGDLQGGDVYITGYEIKPGLEEQIADAIGAVAKRPLKVRYIDSVTRDPIPGFDGVGLQASMPTIVSAYEVHYEK